MDLSDFIFVLKTRLWWIIASTIVGVAAAALITFSMTPVYTAKATLFVSTTSNADTAYARGQFALQRVGSYPQLINEPKLINEVIREVGINRSFQEVKANLTATNPTDTVLLTVTANAPKASEAADIANTAARLLADSIGKLENTDPKALAVKADLSVPAAEPAFASAPRKSVNLALGLVSGLSLGLLLAMVLHKLDPRILRGRDAERQLNLRVLGTVNPLLINERSNHVSSSRLGYRHLVSNLLMANDGRMPRRILVLSTRTDTVIDGQELAQTLAAAGKRAVVVQADESMAPVDTAGAEPIGLTQVLDGSNELNDAVLRIDSVPMAYVPAGPRQESLRKYDVFSRLEAVMSSLEAEFDVAIFVASLDGYPVDATAIALHSDCVMVACRERRTTYHQVRRSLEELNAVRIGATGLLIVKKPHIFQRRRGR
ncbi:Wzz/FepE/Etk N-terminal domain-containing protein [Glutamicibacter sp. JC586]|uniref:Wzz/FepE/Etk N-terminal domain-containing protein n=1 Tax=Glutamicibacter sp. JC586 TaxID=2590552 RepID=UPI00135B9031|nr:Wzz/FepE/Etk N-terminal domain-containing protein [Glutamicibacter sp. JC586]